MSIKTIGAALGGAVAIGLSVSAAPAEALSFNFSYTFSSGESISGTVDGDLQPDNNTVRNLSNLSATYSGQPGTQLTFLAPPLRGAFFTLSGSPEFTFFGFASDPNTSTLQPNFGFRIGLTARNGAIVGPISTRTADNSFTTFFPSASTAEEFEPFSASRWRASAVPTPALLPGLIGMGVATLRKRRQEKSETVEV